MPAVTGAEVAIVLPAEAMHLVPATLPEAEIRATYGRNVVACTINRLQLVGHIMQFGLTLPNGETVALEGHAEKYHGDLAAGGQGIIAWAPADATLIAR